MQSRLYNLGYAMRLSTGASRDAPAENQGLCKLGYARYAVLSRLCNLGYASHAMQGKQCNLELHALLWPSCAIIITIIIIISPHNGHDHYGYDDMTLTDDDGADDDDDYDGDDNYDEHDHDNYNDDHGNGDNQHDGHSGHNGHNWLNGLNGGSKNVSFGSRLVFSWSQKILSVAHKSSSLTQREGT